MTDEPTETLSIDFVLGVTVKIPFIAEFSYPIKNPTLKYCTPFLVKVSIDATDAFVLGSPVL